MELRSKITAHAREAEAVWGKAYGLFSAVLKEHGLKKGVELGVAFGGHSEALFERANVEKLYGVDPYRHIRGYKDPMNLPQEEFDELHAFVLDRFERFGDRYEHVRSTSEEAVAHIPGNLDFVYIDADHSYEGVAKDLGLWFPKVRTGGVIGGHDYGHPNFPGVKRAIDEFFSGKGLLIHEEGEGVWWTVKEKRCVSFIIPAYNCAHTVGGSVRSIAAGNMEEGDEIVITDDGSTDGTSRVLQDLAARYPFVRVIIHEKNKGGAAARNTAVKNAKNDLIFCLDSDNLLVPGSIAKLKTHLFASGSDAAAFGALHYFQDDPEQVTHKWVLKPGRQSLADSLSGFVTPIASGNYLYTKESWEKAGGYPEFAKALDAWGFGLRQLATGTVMSVLQGSFYLHRYGHGSYWVRESDEKDRISFAILEPFLGMIEEMDAAYVRANTSSWFSNLQERPIRAKGEVRGVCGKVRRASLLYRALEKFKKI